MIAFFFAKDTRKFDLILNICYNFGVGDLNERDYFRDGKVRERL